MQHCNRIYYSKVFWRLSMFRAAYRSSSGAPNCICSLLFIYPYGDQPLPRLSGHSVPTQPWQRLFAIWVYKQEAANAVWSSWWWAVCRSKHAEPSKNFGIINSITMLHLVGISTESYYSTRTVNGMKERDNLGNRDINRRRRTATKCDTIPQANFSHSWRNPQANTNRA